MSLLSRIFGETRQRAALEPLYRAVVALGRDPAWYCEGGVPDTLDGRFDMVAAILALVLIRLEGEGEAGRGPSVRLTELFIDDMDGNLRQIGIGDHVVGKHVGRMMSALGGRIAAFRERPFGGAVRRNIFHDSPPSDEAVETVCARLEGFAEALRAAGAMTAPEFSRPLGVDTLGEEPRRLDVEAEEAERAGLARRFALIAIGRLAAKVAVSRKSGEIVLEGILTASVTQACVATGEPVEARIESPFAILFRPQPEPAGREEEFELSEGEMDVVFYNGGAIDVGEAVAETLLLNLDPYPRAPGAEEVLKAAGVKSEEEAGPFGALAGLRDKLKE